VSLDYIYRTWDLKLRGREKFASGYGQGCSANKKGVGTHPRN